jgi:hypothetical protein
MLVARVHAGQGLAANISSMAEKSRSILFVQHLQNATHRRQLAGDYSMEHAEHDAAAGG